MKTAILVMLSLGAVGTAHAQDFRIGSVPSAATSPRCAQLSGEAQVAVVRVDALEDDVVGKRAALDQVEQRLAAGGVQPEELMRLLQARLTLWDGIRGGERALHDANSRARMVAAQLDAAGCR